jgi:hypothetical protein
MQKLSALALPTALLASGCGDPGLVAPPQVPRSVALRAPPSAAAYDWGEVPPPHPMTIPSSVEVARRWMLPERNPWAAYQKATLLSALDPTERRGHLPDVERLYEVSRARTAAEETAIVGLPDVTMWVVDLRGAASVAFGATLSRWSRAPVSTVMTFHNWPADNETVPAEETLAALATMSPLLPTGTDAGVPVFLLDAWRLTHRYDRPDEEATDNRYMLTASDLPSAAVLLQHRIARVLYVVDNLNSSQAEEDDLHAIFASYQEAGIHIGIVDLAELTATARRRTLMPYYGQTLLIDPYRATLVEDPSFYFRARGGFGGTEVIYGGGFAFGGGYGHAFGSHGGG